VLIVLVGVVEPEWQSHHSQVGDFDIPLVDVDSSANSANLPPKAGKMKRGIVDDKINDTCDYSWDRKMEIRLSDLSQIIVANINLYGGIRLIKPGRDRTMLFMNRLCLIPLSRLTSMFGLISTYFAGNFPVLWTQKLTAK
jgi:hypothetical protein